MTTLFISDLHLEQGRPELTRAFLHLLGGEARDSEALYILGDLFEAWIGDDDDSEIAVTVSNSLLELSNSGVAVYFMRGNRDFLVGQQFAKQAGCRLLEDPTTIDLYGEKTLLMHGDSLCTDDEQYINFRNMVRSSQWQTEVLAKPLNERRALAKQLRDNSIEAKSNKAEDIMDVNQQQVIRVMEAHQAQTLIHGHTHRPAVHSLNANGRDAKRYVLGDWGKKGWIIRANEQGLKLDNFIIPG
jgi:UDP-2,3-diacylglucosamine hydrolase